MEMLDKDVPVHVAIQSGVYRSRVKMGTYQLKISCHPNVRICRQKEDSLHNINYNCIYHALDLLKMSSLRLIVRAMKTGCVVQFIK
jgi:hypothetical protein